MKKQFFLFLVLFFAFQLSIIAQNNSRSTVYPSDVSHGFTYDFEKAETAIMRELIQPSAQTAEAKQLIVMPTFPKLNSTSIDVDYKKKLSQWMEANSSAIINAFKNNQDIVTPY